MYIVHATDLDVPYLPSFPTGKRHV
jgi:hypothetical protein